MIANMSSDCSNLEAYAVHGREKRVPENDLLYKKMQSKLRQRCSMLLILGSVSEYGR